MLRVNTLIAVMVGVVLGLIVHIVAIFALPLLMDETAQQRAEQAGPLNAMTVLSAENSSFFQSDPAFEAAICPYDVAQAPLFIVAPLSRHYTSLTFFTPEGVAYGGLNDRATTRKQLEVYIATAEQRRDLQGLDESDKIILQTPQVKGFVLLRGMKAFASETADLRARLAQARCAPVQN